MRFSLKRLGALRGIAVTGGVRGGGALLELAFSIAVAKILGLEASGSFFVALTMLLVLVALARGGLDFAIVREIATAREFDRVDDIPVLTVAGGVRVFIYGLCGSILLIVGLQFPWVRVALGSDATVALGLLAPAIPFAALAYYFAECLKGLEKIQIGQFVYGWPIYGLALGWAALFGSNLELGTASIGFTLASAAAALIGGVLVFSRTGFPASFRDLLKVKLDQRSFALFWIRPITLLANWAPIWILNYFAGPEAAGAFAIANRLAASLLLISISVEARSAPRFARLASKGDLAAAKRELLKVALISGALSTIAALPLALMFKPILAFMGGAFIEAAFVPGLVLIGAYALNGFLAPIGTFALMVGRTGVALSVSVLSVIVVTLVVGSSAGAFGALGGAVALLIMFPLRGALYVGFLRRSLLR